MPELRHMKLLPVISFLLSILAAWFFLFGSHVDGEPASDPTLKASDAWCVWEMWDASRVPVDGATWWRPGTDEKLHKFSNDSLVVFHTSRAIDTDLLPAKVGGVRIRERWLPNGKFPTNHIPNSLERTAPMVFSSFNLVTIE